MPTINAVDEGHLARAYTVTKRKAAIEPDTPAPKRQQQSLTDPESADILPADTTVGALRQVTESGHVHFKRTSGPYVKQERDPSPEVRRLAETVMTSLVEDRVQQLAEEFAHHESDDIEQSTLCLEHAEDATKPEFESIRKRNLTLKREKSELEQRLQTQLEAMRVLKNEVCVVTEDYLEQKQLYETAVRSGPVRSIDFLTSKLRGDLDNALHNIETTQKSNNKLRREAGDLSVQKNNFAQGQERNARLRKELGEVKAEVDKLRTANIKIEDLKKDNSQLRSEIHNLKTRAQQSAWEPKAREAHSLKAAAEQKLRTSEERRQSLEKSEARLREKNFELLKQVDNAQKELRKRDQQSSSAESDIAGMKEEVEKLRAKNKEQKAQLNRFNEKILRMNRELERLRKSPAKVAAKIVFDESALDAAQEKIRQLNDTIESLQKQLVERDATIVQFRRQDASNKLRTGKNVAESALKSEKATTKAMFAQYDTVQNKNTVLIGKLTMMAQAGGFGNPGSMYRKELDSLKAPSLEELDEYKGLG